MSVLLELIDGIVVMDLGPDFVSSQGDSAFRCAYFPYVQQRHRFVIDLARVDQLNSDRIASLVDFFNKVSERDSVVHFCGMQPSLREIFRVTRLDRVFPFFPGRAEAIAAHRKAAAT